MGKQKSFILVGSVFLGFIVLMLLLTIISSNVKETKIEFDADIYYVEVGKTRGLTPTVYAGGDVLDGVAFEYESENPEIFTTLPGCYAAGSAPVECWAFREDGGADIKKTITPYHEDDVVTIQADESGTLYWYVNGEKTRARANKQYSADEIVGMLSKDYANIDCFFLNGEPTNIPYDKNITPVRNEETGTWFIDGVDTNVKYDSIPATIVGNKLGTAKVTTKCVIEGKEYVLTATIKVCEPDPKTLELNYVYNTAYVKLNDTFAIDYKVVGASEEYLPLQDVIITKRDGLTIDGINVTGNKVGKYSVNISVPEASFQLDMPVTLSKTISVVVVDTTDEQIELLKDATEAIYNIGTLSSSDECKARYEAAKAIVSLLDEDNYNVLTNKAQYEAAQKKFENSSN